MPPLPTSAFTAVHGAWHVCAACLSYPSYFLLFPAFWGRVHAGGFLTWRMMGTSNGLKNSPAAHLPRLSVTTNTEDDLERTELGSSRSGCSSLWNKNRAQESGRLLVGVKIRVNLRLLQGVLGPFRHGIIQGSRQPSQLQGDFS